MFRGIGVEFDMGEAAAFRLRLDSVSVRTSSLTCFATLRRGTPTNKVLIRLFARERLG